MKKFNFKIKGMDCAEEVAVLKKAVGPLVGGESHLSFDILKSKMMVEVESDRIQEKILDSVKKTGMEAIPWEKISSDKSPTSKAQFVDKKFLMTVASGVFLLCGFFSHLYFHKSIVDIVQGRNEHHSMPLLSIVFYALSIISAIWFVLPNAILAVRTLNPNMNLLMTLAVIGAVSIGEWFEGATVIFLFAISLYLESWSVAKAHRAIESLLQIAPLIARCFSVEGKIEEKRV